MQNTHEKAHQLESVKNSKLFHKRNEAVDSSKFGDFFTSADILAKFK